jgi:erythritol kinase
MTAPAFIGIDAGTSVIKAVAFEADGRQIADASRPNSYRVLPNGGVEQGMERTWTDAAAVVRDLVERVPGLAPRVAGLAVTGQGDGCWLVDAAGEPVHDGWLWLDGRAGREARELAQGDRGALIYERTGAGITVCQMRTQLAWMQRHAPELLDRAATALHPKDFLYLRLTGERATCPAESVFTFGNFRTRDYDPEVFEALGMADLRRLAPPIVDGSRQAHPLSAAAAAATGLPQGLPVTLAYLDVVCCALGAGLYDATARPGLSIVGSTGIHMIHVADAASARLNPDRTGYVCCFPDGYIQMQLNMAATLNIDWLLDVGREVLAAHGVERSRAEMLAGLDAKVAAARPGAALYHPYISPAGERGPFADPDARASLTGLMQGTGWFDLVRAVFEGLAFAARDCYGALGARPAEIRLSGGAARSKALRAIYAAVLDAPVRPGAREEAGAAGACMTAAVREGLYPDLAACCTDWVAPHLGGAVEAPDPALAKTYAPLFDRFVETRRALAPTWGPLAETRRAAP